MGPERFALSPSLIGTEAGLNQDAVDVPRHANKSGRIYQVGSAQSTKKSGRRVRKTSGGTKESGLRPKCAFKVFFPPLWARKYERIGRACGQRPPEAASRLLEPPSQRRTSASSFSRASPACLGRALALLLAGASDTCRVACRPLRHWTSCSPIWLENQRFASGPRLGPRHRIRPCRRVRPCRRDRGTEVPVVLRFRALPAPLRPFLALMSPWALRSP
jgi:hypothetical protein